MKTINYISKYAFSALIFGVVLVSMPLNTISAEMECSLGRTAVTMTNDKSGKTRVLCLPDQAVSGIENAADHSAIEISASCPCWTEEEILKYDSTLPSVSCETNTGDFGTTCYSIDPKDPKLITEVVGTYNNGTNSSCTNYVDPKKFNTTSLELKECEALLSGINTYDACPCWSEKDLAYTYSQKAFGCSDNSSSNAIECFITGTNTLLFAAGTNTDGTNICLNDVKGDGVKQTITDREYIGCRVSLDPYQEK